MSSSIANIHNDLKSARILCVDSDPSTAELVRSMMRSFDCVVDSTDNGRGAFTLLNERLYDLCIVEYSIRDMIGVQLCSLLRHAGCRVPVMFFTNRVGEVEMQRAIAAGADGYLSKGVDSAHLTRVVSGLLDIRRDTPAFAKAA